MKVLNMLKRIKIKSIKKINDKRHVYDLSVVGNHNFFIGNTEILTHNCDFLSINGQASLRNPIEQYSKITRFILTANYHEKIINPIKSRCQLFEVVPPSRKEVAIHMAKILNNENVSFKLDVLKVLIDHTYPDIRQLINYCQRNTVNGVLSVNTNDIIDSDFRLKLLNILLSEKSKKDIFKDVRQLVADNHVSDFSDVYSFLY